MEYFARLGRRKRIRRTRIAAGSVSNWIKRMFASDADVCWNYGANDELDHGAADHGISGLPFTG